MKGNKSVSRYFMEEAPEIDGQAIPALKSRIQSQ
jgi:hypothetical protein